MNNYDMIKKSLLIPPLALLCACEPKNNTAMENTSTQESPQTDTFSRDIETIFLEIAGKYEEAFQTLQEAAESGDAHSMYRIGAIYEEGGFSRDKGRILEANESTAVEWYLKAAQNGSPEGAAAIAGKYLEEEYKDLSKKEILELLSKARGETACIAELMTCKIMRKDAPFNTYQRLEHLTLRCRHIDPPKSKLSSNDLENLLRNTEIMNSCSVKAMIVIAELLNQGSGVPKDQAKAYMYLNIAAATGSPDAISKRMELESEIHQEAITEGQALSREEWPLYELLWFGN